MTYGHAERNLAFIRQLEAETRQLRVRSAVGRVSPSDKHLQGDDEVAPAFSQAIPDLDRSVGTTGHDELPLTSRCRPGRHAGHAGSPAGPAR